MTVLTPIRRPTAIVAWLLITVFILLNCNVRADDSEDTESAKRWESAIEKFAQQDKMNPPPSDPILFVGSSSIRMWDLQKYFPDLPTINRGFGGSQTSDVLHYFDRIVVPYKPKAIVMYVGDNDIASGKSPKRVVDDFNEFVKETLAAFGETPIAYIAIKPSIARWKLYEKIDDANKRIQKICEQDGHLTFVDIAKPMIGDDGKPRKDLFVKDGLHLNEAGYNLWTRLVMPQLKR